MTAGGWAALAEPVAAGALMAAGVVVAAGVVGPRRARELRQVSAASRVRGAVLGVSRGPLGRLVRRAGGGDRVVGARDVQVVITQVAGLVRSGMPPDRAWAGVGVTVRPDGIPTPADLLHLTSDASQARAVVAACRLAQQVGAPIAPVLDSIVATLVAAAESAAERDTALASPRSTARLLLWLPAAGAVVATVLGAGPVQLLLGGGPAVLAPVTGALLLAVGRWWTRRLVQAAVGDHPAG
ncbi:hypothetical protein Sked_33350 [Sanguibacter keddieii DSM 10542]|uniref:Flp pilus assembly protein TadB n=1 Tax=Sanguibacter keddieii (strain ATCC 51767 / DSM 10542 / NCFB 3025 / ST-74) TaxID=446469 RepID=D1BE09_SANKS|nr:hypothetical protein [Sanguibacter keddieii]ACZ23230.1 hypothetical protein Sked_33350 [Sanguibacter keddieii DSM 10542]